MNEEKQRIAIAEAIGWTVINDTLCHVTPDKNGDQVVAAIARLPDYLADLNSMHEAEKIMTEDQWLSYTINVLLAAKDGTFVIDINMKTVAHAFDRIAPRLFFARLANGKNNL
jgi:hypothetical protein